MNDLYLILHKVRGEPAFDIAQNIGDETGDLWIIPTSGHRAYPNWWVPLSHCIVGDGFVAESFYERSFADLPDHYSANKSPPDIDRLRAKLGLKAKTPNLIRRTI